MFLRPVLRAAPLARVNAARALSSSAPRRGDHHDSHSSSSEADTTESFFSAGWVATFGLVAAGYAAYLYLPSTQVGSGSSALSNDALEAKAKDESAPWLTRVLSKELAGEDAVWTKRNDKHLELACEAADTKLIIQDAERPKVHRLTYPSAFEQASPHSIAVGSQCDLSDLVVKSESS
ncbi:uncharacterized protein EHS24_002393 [Apiotrichum porosum]|uniref:Uncharacterized protein n=1 Tax=Apiotrichum porosum TaxID=105984 RepID=A0A427XIS2_9TREE|nr:uncharacterized protein EHS24_002393 [Apiotrichum porosum]RSH78664.1 hypothetical protein EHS24_002393 [Apiotrichum porosum]